MRSLRAWHFALVWWSVVILLATAVEAQVIQPPRRVSQRPPADDRLRQHLTLETELLGGRDDNLAPQGGNQFGPQLEGYTGYGATRLGYWVGHEKRSFEARGGGFVNSFRNVGLKPSYGGDLLLRARTEIGRKTDLDVSQGARSDPYFTLGAFDALQRSFVDRSGGALDSSPTRRLSEIRSLSLNTRATVRQRWTRRTSTEFSYGFDDRNYEEGPAFDSRRHSGGLSFDRTIGRSSGVRATYRYSDYESTDVDADSGRFPIQSHTTHVGFVYGKDLSRTRRLEISGGAGPTYTETISRLTREPRQFWAPSAYGGVNVDVGQAWTLYANYRRAISVLEGTTPEPFIMDAASVGLGGLVRDRVEVAFSGAYSNGQAGGLVDAVEPGQFHSYAVTSQVSVQMTGWSSAIASYTHYRYTLNAAASLSLGLSPILHRNTVYVGLAVNVPLVGGVPGRM